MRGPLDRGQTGRRNVAQQQPQPQRIIARKGVADTGALPLARDHPGGMKGLQMLGRVGP